MVPLQLHLSRGKSRWHLCRTHTACSACVLPRQAAAPSMRSSICYIHTCQPLQSACSQVGKHASALLCIRLVSSAHRENVCSWLNHNVDSAPPLQQALGWRLCFLLLPVCLDLLLLLKVWWLHVLGRHHQSA